MVQAATIQTARGEIIVQDGEVLKRNTMRDGQIVGLKDVVFNGWNFARPSQPHSEIFVNCENLTFYQCNLTNVEIPADSTVIDCLTIHRKEYNEHGKRYIEIQCGDNKTRTYEVDTEIDLVDEDLMDIGIEDLSPQLKQSIVEHYVLNGKPTISQDGEELILINTEETPNEIGQGYRHISRFIN